MCSEYVRRHCPSEVLSRLVLRGSSLPMGYPLTRQNLCGSPSVHYIFPCLAYGTNIHLYNVLQQHLSRTLFSQIASTRMGQYQICLKAILRGVTEVLPLSDICHVKFHTPITTFLPTLFQFFFQ